MPTTRKPRAAKKPTAAEELASPPAEQGEVLDPAAAAPQPPEQAQPDAVLVVKIVDENGNIGTDVAPIGNVQVTEVQTLLELGLNGWRQKIGLDKSN